ncbi:hypothetical protein Tco_1429439 [Tanacetum coccineum]
MDSKTCTSYYKFQYEIEILKLFEMHAIISVYRKVFKGRSTWQTFAFSHPLRCLIGDSERLWSDLVKRNEFSDLVPPMDLDLALTSIPSSPSTGNSYTHQSSVASSKQDVTVVVISVGFCYDWLLSCNYGKGFLDSGGRGSNHRKKQGLSGINAYTGVREKISTSRTGIYLRLKPHSTVPVYGQANVQVDADYRASLHLDSVHKVNDRMKDSLYGYFIGKRLAFPVVEWYGYIKNHKKTVKNGQARTRESVEYKAEARKVKPQSNPVKEKSTHGQQKSTTRRQDPKYST